MPRNRFFFLGSSRLFALVALVLCRLLMPKTVCAASVYELRPADPQAVYVSASGGDASELLQAAIDQVERERNFGIVFVEAGEYRLTRTVYIWKGVRIIGYGPSRPRFVLPESTPGFADDDVKYLFHFASDMPKAGEPIRDANPGTFYSALSNVDIEIADGNPVAVGVRSHFAQHCFLSHIDFRIGEGRAGVDEVGNLIQSCRFFGGEYGIMTQKPSPSWPFVLIDSVFDGQREAAILTEEAGMTILRARFANTKSAVVVRENRAEELYIESSRFERISGPAVLLSETGNARAQCNLIDVACVDVPLLARLRESGREFSGGGDWYRVKEFVHGLHIDGLGAPPRIDSTLEIEMWDGAEKEWSPDIPPLPRMSTWVNALDLGLVGDGTTDNTSALRQAIAEHATIYFPSGRYRISDTVKLKPCTTLIGFSPIATQIVIAEDEPAFTGAGSAKAVLESSLGGRDLIFGIGIDTAQAPPPTAYSEEGLSERRWWKRQKKHGPVPNRAVALKWMAGEDSLVSDVRFLGGHGTYYADGTAVPGYNNNRTGDADPERKWDSQYTSLWVTNGGGGKFLNIWTPNSYAQSGMLIENTDTPGRTYQISSEHHVRNELVVRNVANWRFYAFQLEEEAGEGPHVLPVRIERSRDLVFANLYLYRVMRTKTPYPHGVLTKDCSNILFRGVHAYGPSKYTFDDTVFDQTSGERVRTREIARMRISSESTLAQPAKVKRLASGFSSIDSIEIDDTGDVYFVDSAMQSIYRWSVARESLDLVCDLPIEPVGVVAYGDGKLLVVARTGSVYSISAEDAAETLTALEPREEPLPEAARIAYPVTLWRDEHTFLEAYAEPKMYHYLTPDRQVALPADARFVEARSGSSWFSTIDLVRAHDLAIARPGERILVADEFGQKTYSFAMGADGTFGEPRLLAEEGEGGVAMGPDGRIYVCAGDVLVFDEDGTLAEQVRVPERPSCVAFGGADGRTLFIAARGSLYSVRIP